MLALSRPKGAATGSAYAYMKGGAHANLFRITLPYLYHQNADKCGDPHSPEGDWTEAEIAKPFEVRSHSGNRCCSLLKKW